jgi:hypothetical protein
MPTVPDPTDSHSGPADAPTPSGAARTFTVAEANRLLPYLRSALAEARRHLDETRAAFTELRHIEAVGRTPSGDWILAGDHRAATARLAECQTACERVLERIADHGCQVKDLASGLCDFPAVVGGEAVLLCWRLDEPAVAHYHGYLDGFRGRRPLPPDTP